jgi:hypothetical protein
MIKQEIIKERDHKWTSTQLQLSFHYNMFGISGGGFRRREDIKVDEFFKRHSESLVTYTGGFRKWHSQDTLKEWDASISDAQDLLEGVLKPLSDHIHNSPVKAKNFEKIIKSYSETGKVLIQNVIFAESLLGYSFDAKTMRVQNPVSLNSLLESESTKMMKTMNETFETSSKSEFQKYISKQSVSSFENGFATYTREFIELQDDENVAVAERNFIMKELTMKSLPTQFTNEFNEAIEKLPRKYDQEIYHGFVEAWGTHFVNSIQVGGSIQVIVQSKKSIQNSLDDAKVILNKIVENSSFNTKSMSENHSNVKLHWKGGKKVNGWGAYVKSVQESPEVLKFGIVPITSMIKDSIKRENLEKFLQIYFKI